MKRLFALVLAVISILSLFSGCGKYKPGNSDVSAESVLDQMSQKYKDKGHPVGVIVMETGGTVVFELYEDVAPNTVNNFIELANSGFYDGTVFHRVIPGFMIQGGDPQGTGRGGPGYNIEGEFSNNNFPNELLHERGVISMARRGDSYYPERAYNTAGSQFFIMVADYPSLDKDYASFGKVLEGMEVVDSIVSVETNSADKPIKEQKMKAVRVETFGVTYPSPEKLPER